MFYGFFIFDMVFRKGLIYNNEENIIHEWSH